MFPLSSVKVPFYYYLSKYLLYHKLFVEILSILKMSKISHVNTTQV